jgi:hypothetical protein
MSGWVVIRSQTAATRRRSLILILGDPVKA